MYLPKRQEGLGFKDLKVFNLALFVKQEWHIMNVSTSLLHHLYKAKNFLHNFFLKSSLDSNPSYAWRGITKAKPWLLQGYRWSIGNGENVSIWQDKWVLCQSTLCPPIPRSTNTIMTGRDDKVSKLLNSEALRWDVQQVHNYFPPNLSCVILKIPLLPYCQLDTLIWDLEENGFYSVRSA